MKKYTLTLIISLFVLILQAQRPQVELIPKDPNVKIGKLANGLTYYIRRNTEPKKRAELYLVNKVGSLQENDDQQGLAHFLEHMAFNGTTDFPKNEIINYLQKSGVRFGADVNAHTGFNQTVYQLPIPTDSSQLFRDGFKILANWAGKISLEGTEIDNERGVVIEEDRMRNKNASARMGTQLVPVLMRNSRFENRIPIGKVEVLKNFTYDKIRNFYRDWYRPDMQAVIAVGDFDVIQVEQLIKENFSDFKNPTHPKPLSKYDLPDNKEPIVKILTDPEQANVVVQVIYKQRIRPIQTTADMKLSLMYSYINSMLENRYQEIMLEEHTAYLSASGGFAPFQGGVVPGLKAFATQVVTDSGTKLEKALKAALSENERMVKFGFTNTELAMVKRNMQARSEYMVKEKDKMTSASFVSEYINNFLTDNPIPSLDFFFTTTKKIIESTTLAEVNELAKTLFDKKNKIIIVQAPQKEKSNLPSEARLLAIVKNTGMTLKPYVSAKFNEPLLQQLPVPGKIIATKKHEEIGVTELTLSNGIKVFLKPTDFINDQVMFNSFGKGGLSLASDSDYAAAQMYYAIRSAGVGNFNAIRLRNYLNGSTATASLYIGQNSQGFSGSASFADLENALQLMYAYATHPRRDTVVFSKSLSDFKTFVQQGHLSPSTIFGDTVRAVLNGYHKRGISTPMADLEKITWNQTYNFYKDTFADLGNQVFVFVGAFDLDKLTPLLEKYVGSLPANNSKREPIDHGIRMPKGRISKTVYKGVDDKATVQLHLHGTYTPSASANLQLDALKAILDLKMLERLREKEGGVYSSTVSINLQNFPVQQFDYVIAFNCAPVNVEKLVAAALDEINNIKVNGCSEEDLHKFLTGVQRQQELLLRNNNYWLSYLRSQLEQGWDLKELNGLNKRLEGVTVQSVKAAANKYLNEDNLIKLVLLPERAK